MIWVVPAVVAVGALTGILLVHRIRLTPKRLRRLHQAIALLALVAFAFSAAPFLFNMAPLPKWAWIVGAAWAAGLAVLAYVGWFRKPTDQEITTTFGLDPQHCPQCEYDLTGNVSRRCPECGWAIPELGDRWERPSWPLWWKQWRIDYLHHWRTTLYTAIFNAVMLSGGAIALAVWLGTRGLPASAILGLLGLHWAINAVRIVQYARSLKPQT